MSVRPKRELRAPCFELNELVSKSFRWWVGESQPARECVRVGRESVVQTSAQKG